MIVIIIIISSSSSSSSSSIININNIDIIDNKQKDIHRNITTYKQIKNILIYNYNSNTNSMLKV